MDIRELKQYKIDAILGSVGSFYSCPAYSGVKKQSRWCKRITAE